MGSFDPGELANMNGDVEAQDKESSKEMVIANLVGGLLVHVVLEAG